MECRCSTLMSGMPDAEGGLEADRLRCSSREFCPAGGLADKGYIKLVADLRKALLEESLLRKSYS